MESPTNSHAEQDHHKRRVHFTKRSHPDVGPNFGTDVSHQCQSSADSIPPVERRNTRIPILCPIIRLQLYVAANANYGHGNDSVEALPTLTVMGVRSPEEGSFPSPEAVATCADRSPPPVLGGIQLSGLPWSPAGPSSTTFGLAPHGSAVSSRSPPTSRSPHHRPRWAGSRFCSGADPLGSRLSAPCGLR
jgi:hypothetical protein